MNFGKAIEALKTGQEVARSGWNGKGMYLSFIRGTNTDDGKNTTAGDYLVNSNVIGPLGLLPWIGMKTVDDDFVPWLASQTDMLAEDWEIIQLTKDT
ncbi:MAG: DUF2829 domain-containing protein [Planctomycetes bacterium]|nr:DUF2829 domain-containing protein [Planctomycetota bacterium]